MNELWEYFQNNNDRLINKWHHYFDVYDRYFSRYKDKEIVMLEIGVYQGGSLRMWKKYFGDKVKIYAIDIDPNCKKFEEDGVQIFIGSQSDRNFLRDVLKQIPPIDVFIDDGGHSMKQQIVSFEEIFPHIKNTGVYLCEDLHTSYWKDYGGGYKRKNSFIEYSKNWIDYLNAYHSVNDRLQINDFTKSVKAIHYYDSIVVLEKADVQAPKESMTGLPTIENPIAYRKKNFFERNFNEVMSRLNLPFHID